MQQKVSGKPRTKRNGNAAPQEREAAWPADHVSRRNVSELVPYAQNARTHTPEQVDQIVHSIKEWGWTTPVLVDEQGSIIAGHARVMAAQQIGLTEVPVMTATGWSDAQKRAYVIADNKLALNSGWDNDLLSLELSDLKDLGFALDLTGFPEFELDELLNGGAEKEKISDTREIDPNEFDMQHRCPKCGFEFDD